MLKALPPPVRRTHKPTICSCVVLPFLCLFNNGHSWHHWALSQCPALCCLLSVSSEPSSFRAVLFPECTLPPAGEVPLLWEKAPKPFHEEGDYITRNSRWASVFTGLSRRENPVIRPVELNEQFPRTSTCQLAAIFSEGPYPQGACRDRGEKKNIYIYIYQLLFHESSHLDTLMIDEGFPGSSSVKNPPANAGNAGLIPGSRRSPRGENSNPL